MRMLMTLLIGLSIVCLAAAADMPAEPITKPGEQSLYGGKVKVVVSDDRTVCKFEVTFAGSAGDVVKKFDAKSAAATGWFVVAESAGKVWLYRGGNDLFLIEYTDNPPGGPKGGKSSTVGFAPGETKTVAALSSAPKAVLERLPASFKTPAKTIK